MLSSQRLQISYFQITPMLGIKSTFDNTRMTTVLGIQPTEVKKSVIDMAYSLIEKNMIPKRY